MINGESARNPRLLFTVFSICILLTRSYMTEEKADSKNTLSDRTFSIS
jgi:hypothetical protein